MSVRRTPQEGNSTEGDGNIGTFEARPIIPGYAAASMVGAILLDACPFFSGLSAGIRQNERIIGF